MIIFFILFFNWAKVDSLLVKRPVSYLIKIDLQEREDIYKFDHLGVPILQDMDTYILADISYDSVKFLKKSKFRFQILDTNPRDQEYYFVFLVAEKDSELLKPFGKILLSDTNVAFGDKEVQLQVVLLRAFKNKEGLFKGRWELKKLRKSPIKIKHPQRKQFGLEKDFIIEEIVNTVNLDSIKTYIQKMQDFVTRYSFTDSCISAGQWVYNKFNSFGIDSIFYHWFESGYGPNVIATIVGSTTPQRVYIISGHYDCTSQCPDTLAPGADDNASGTAAVIEATRVLSIYEFESTVRFIAFCGEEQGLIGSGYYATGCSSNGDSILGTLNCDMIGYNAGSNTIAVGKNLYSEWLANFFIACIDSYVTELNAYKFDAGEWSDHTSFWDEGYDAITSIEDDFNPNYHTIGDTLGLLDPIFFTKVVKANIATLASLAVPKFPGVEENAKHKPQNAKLEIYPNLFTQKTVIKCRVESSELKDGQLQIYDLAGRIVRNWKLEIGNWKFHEVAWDGKDMHNRNVTSGIYFCELNAGKIHQVQKIIKMY